MQYDSRSLAVGRISWKQQCSWPLRIINELSWGVRRSEIREEMEFCMLLKRLQVFVACLVLTVGAMPLQANTNTNTSAGVGSGAAAGGTILGAWIVVGAILTYVAWDALDDDDKAAALAGDLDTDPKTPSDSTSSSSSTPSSSTSSSATSSSGT